MKLIDILARELPKRGGWPAGSEGCRQFPDGEVCFNEVGMDRDFYTECATDVFLLWSLTTAPHISKEQYELAIRKPVNNKRYEAIEALFAVLNAGTSTSQDSIDIYDAIAAGKVPGVKLED